MLGAQAKKSPDKFLYRGFQILAEWTGLEPATPGVTGRYSNQLNYHSRYMNLLSHIIEQVPQPLKPNSCEFHFNLKNLIS